MKPLYQILTETQETQKQQLPRMEILEDTSKTHEIEVAELFYENMILEADNADLWYEIMKGVS